MPVEFRILSGARAGQMQRFEQQAVIVVGRQQQSDLRFDPRIDLDVSGRHCEIRGVDGRYELHDQGSTNGTYVNGKKVAGSVVLKDGDTITFGAKGPKAEFRIWDEGQGTPPAGVARSTEQRIAVAVKEQTKGMWNVMAAALVVVVLGVGAAFLMTRRASNQRIEALQKQVEANDSMRVVLQNRFGATGDTTFTNSLKRKLDDQKSRLEQATTPDERKRLQAEMDETQQQLSRLAQVDFPSIHRRNNPATVLLISDITGSNSAGTGFAITADGVIITNRHNVQNPQTKALANRIAVKFTEKGDWLIAKIVKVSDGDADLALIKVEHPGFEGPFPVVEGISRGSEVTEGVSVVSIGYPSGYDTPMEGTGNNFIAKSTLSAGTVSKRTSSVLQMDTFATHGSSGSPVFGPRGLVVGVVYGGLADAGGRIVYAVPPDKIAEFLPDSLKRVIRD